MYIVGLFQTLPNVTYIIDESPNHGDSNVFALDALPLSSVRLLLLQIHFEYAVSIAIRSVLHSGIQSLGDEQ
jgi:hypothetical protein